MLEFKNKNQYINVFDNLNELANYVSKRPTKPGRSNDSVTDRDDEFYGTRTLEEAVELLKYGDENLYKEIKREKEKIDVSKMLGALNKRQTYEKKVYGCMVNVPAYLQNNPINMINIEKNTPANRILNIFLNIRISGGMDKSITRNCGIKYLTIIDLLEKAGYRCNLYSGVANEDDCFHSMLLVKIKTDKEPLNLKKICYPIANVSMQRRIKFRWMEVNDGDHDFTHGYGSIENDKYIKETLDEKLKDNIIVWNYESSNVGKDIPTLLKDLEKKYGIKIGE